MQKKSDECDWSGLTPEQRIARCRDAAKEADEYTQIAQPGLREEYKKLAAQWRRLAVEIERSVDIGLRR